MPNCTACLNDCRTTPTDQVYVGFTASTFDPAGREYNLAASNPHYSGSRKLLYRRVRGGRRDSQSSSAISAISAVKNVEQFRIARVGHQRAAISH